MQHKQHSKYIISCTKTADKNLHAIEELTKITVTKVQNLFMILIQTLYIFYWLFACDKKKKKVITAQATFKVYYQMHHNCRREFARNRGIGKNHCYQSSNSFYLIPIQTLYIFYWLFVCDIRAQRGFIVLIDQFCSRFLITQSGYW